MSKRGPSRKAHSNMSSLKKKWKSKNPPDENGNYICWICKQAVHTSVVSMDHVATVEEWPEYKNDLSNLRPSHAFCNHERANKQLSRLRQRKILR